MDDVKKAYSALCAKYRLPSYEELNKELEIEEIEKTSFLLSKIKILIIDKIDEHLKILEGVLQPDVNLSNLCESWHISEEQKEIAYQIFKSLMRLSRHSSEVSVENSGEKNAIFIYEFYVKWQEIKKELSKLYMLLKESWEIDTSIKEDLSYLG